jgi:prepilin-type processing-associated H-X9-DG protein
LLVVVAIIALLISLMVPALTAARAEAKRIVCQTHLKQIAQAWQTYLHTGNGAFPRGFSKWTPPNAVRELDVNYGGRQGTQPAYQCPKILNPHLMLPLVTTRGAEVFSCPLDTGYTVDNQQSVQPDFFTFYGTSYFANPLLIGSGRSPLSPIDPCYGMGAMLDGLLPRLTVSQLSGESRVVLIGDAVWANAWNPASKLPEMQWHRQKRLHNLAFMDGHVDFVRIRKGIHVSAAYTVMPTRETQREAARFQKEINSSKD